MKARAHSQFQEGADDLSGSPGEGLSGQCRRLGPTPATRAPDAQFSQPAVLSRLREACGQSHACEYTHTYTRGERRRWLWGRALTSPERS